jgi:hypothetical protein
LQDEDLPNCRISSIRQSAFVHYHSVKLLDGRGRGGLMESVGPYQKERIGGLVTQPQFFGSSHDRTHNSKLALRRSIFDRRRHDSRFLCAA